MLDGRALDLKRIHRVDRSTGWAVARPEGGHQDVLLRTADGAQTWRLVSPPAPAADGEGTEVDLFGAFLDEDRGWILFYLGYPQGTLSPVWRTTDGGETWQESEPLDPMGDPAVTPIFGVEHIEFVDAQHGWLLVNLDSAMGHAYIMLFRTTDGGATWTRIHDPQVDNGEGDLHYCCRSGMDFADPQTGLLALAPGPIPEVHINWTLDGGLTWSYQALPSPPDQPDLFQENLCGTYEPQLLSPEQAYLWVQCPDETWEDADHYLYHTEDGGQTWATSSYPGGAPYFLGPQVGWALGDQLFRTLDGAETWEPMASLDWAGSTRFVDRNHGWALVSHPQWRLLYRTQDGGADWSPVSGEVLP
jgi:photosystem II stability/assembly factor-like uncharacterized protein